MSSDATAGRIPHISPRLQARVAGVLYLLIIIGAFMAPFSIAPSGLVTSDAAFPTPARILASKSVYVLGGFIQLLVYSCDIAVALIFYELFKPVSLRLVLLATFFRVTFAAIAGANLFNHFAPLVLLSSSVDHGAFTPDQLQALGGLFVRLRTFGFDVALVFFGLHCLLIGYLLFTSTFFPRILGVGLVIAGLVYVANILVTAIPPALAAHLFPYVMLPAGIAEIALTLWLITVGLNLNRWEELAGAAGNRASRTGRAVV
jgi:hypothetical protein